MHVDIGDLTYSNIVSAIKEIVSVFKPINGEKLKISDPSAYYFESFFKDEQSNIQIIANELIDNHYYVINRYEKYYVIAFAINFSRFEVFSKDHNKELISWNKDGPIILSGLITDLNYNENPLDTLIKWYNKYNSNN